MTSITFLLRLALLLLAPLLIASAAPAEPRVPTGPLADGEGAPFPDQWSQIVPAQWRTVLLDVETEFGETVEVDLLRPAAWLRWHGLTEGSRMPFASHELGIDGIATVVGIGRCPESAAGSEPGNRAVTGLVRRTAQNWVTVHLVGQSEPIRCTPEHPIWSKSRQRWVGSGDLEAGEELDAAGDGDEPPSGAAARAVVVERIERHASPAAVFNLEVHRAHTYRVGAERLLVHNENPLAKPTKCGGSLTEPNTPDKVVANQDGVLNESYHKSGDHAPAHLHVSGGGPDTRIGQNGHPLAGDPPLSSRQRAVVEDNKRAIRNAVDQMRLSCTFSG